MLGPFVCFFVAIFDIFDLLIFDLRFTSIFDLFSIIDFSACRLWIRESRSLEFLAND